MPKTKRELYLLEKSLESTVRFVEHQRKQILTLAARLGSLERFICGQPEAEIGTCAVCRFFDPEPEGMCRRTTPESTWPTEADEWCGEWRPRFPIPKDEEVTDGTDPDNGADQAVADPDGDPSGE